MEETTVLPAAREHLTDDDWTEIADAFGQNGDPRFDRDADFRDIFARLMNLTRMAEQSLATQRA